MARPRKNLFYILKIIEQKPLTYSEICKLTKKPMKVVWENLTTAQEEKLVDQDSLKKYHLTSLGKSRINSVEHRVYPISIRCYSQVIDFLKLRPEQPTANCTIIIENADENETNKIKELDAKTDAAKRFLTHDGLWLPENNTNLKAAFAAVVDSILDLKAKQMGLNTILDQQFRDQLTQLPPGYDSMKRYQQLAKTNFKVLIEFNGLGYVEKQDFEDLEKAVEEDNPSTRSKEFSKSIRAMDQTVRINSALYQLCSTGGGGSSDLSPTMLQANNLFGNIAMECESSDI